MKQRIWYFICKKILISLSEKAFNNVVRRMQFLRLGIKYYPLNYGSGKTFSHYILEKKIQKQDELASIVADKVLVRNYVEEKIGKEFLIPIIGIFKSLSEINLDTFPEKFIIKANHGSGWNFICRDKKLINWNLEKKKLNRWLKMNAYYLSREKQYKPIRPKLIVEELIDNEPNDYKFFCFKGVVKAIQVDSGRFTNHERTIFDTDWESTGIRLRYNEITHQVLPPTHFKKMIEIAETLSASFEFARIDLYETNSKLYFGEITLFPGGGTEPFMSLADDLKMRKLVLS